MYHPEYMLVREPKGRNLRVSVTQELHEQIEKLALERDVSIAQIVREALRAYFDRGQNG